MAEIFKAPASVSMETFRYYPPQPSGPYPTIKRRKSATTTSKNQKRRRRTSEDFLKFCKYVLEYENYEQIRSQDLRLRHSSSPLGSTGSSNESWPLLSKDEDAEMYSPHRHKINEVDDINRTDSEEQEDISEEDDRQEEWNQVTCYCGKPFAGRPMVECSKCLTWLHLKCAGLRKSHIPDTWLCSKCKPDKSEQIQVASGSRKRKSTNSKKILSSPQTSPSQS
eukprot:05733.XXX_47799_49717_1 [CDS] Oithona nana genome sequencing.